MVRINLCSTPFFIFLSRGRGPGLQKYIVNKGVPSGFRLSTLFLSNSLEFSSCRECNNEKKIIINKEKNSRDTCLRRCLCVFWFDHPGRPLHNSAIVSSECRRWKGWHRPFQKSQVQPKTGESPSWNLGAFYNRTWSQLLSNYCCIRSERDERFVHLPLCGIDAQSFNLITSIVGSARPDLLAASLFSLGCSNLRYFIIAPGVLPVISA